MIKLTDHDGDPVLFSHIVRVTRMPVFSEENKKRIQKKFKIMPRSIVTDLVGAFCVLETVEEIEAIMLYGRQEPD